MKLTAKKTRIWLISQVMKTRDWPIAVAPKLHLMHTEMRQRGKPTIDFPPENDKPRRVKCTANLQTDGLISKFTYRKLDNYGNTPDYSYVY
jgi:hypothetical protein